MYHNIGRLRFGKTVDAARAKIEKAGLEVELLLREATHVWQKKNENTKGNKDICFNFWNYKLLSSKIIILKNRHVTKAGQGVPSTSKKNHQPLVSTPRQSFGKLSYIVLYYVLHRFYLCLLGAILYRLNRIMMFFFSFSIYNNLNL